MFESRKKLFVYVAAGIVITLNWSLYIWAVNAGYVIQTCMGYFLEPLVVCCFGVVFYKEKGKQMEKNLHDLCFLRSHGHDYRLS